MKVLIIGSKGFIGGYVVASFQKTHFEVYECDVVVDYEKSNYYQIDSTNADYQKIFQDKAFDACINCSGAASVPDSLKNPFRDFTLNTYNVVKLLDAIRTNQPTCKFINLSSAAVYGNPESIPVTENVKLNPISPYGLHKMQSEQICRSFHTYHNVPTCSLRVFSAYGSGLKKQLFWDLYQKAKNTNYIELFGTGKETRDFIHVQDVVDAITCCLHHADFQGESINVANGEEILIEYAVSTFLSFFPEKKTVYFNGKVKAGDPLNWRADISKIQSMGYKPSISLYQGLEQYFQWRSLQ
ncbi:NAD-dependent epimerase/dehydratase family protein [Dyadobacter pollutisoli]|jgi:dTDP-glucose 4,6-dehydratase/UDP-glucose 4-epimerase|uniref:SDR family oxidoreductase n=1 Tax=Dyadobacter pollutisoli TaxID=2910158 RepID=A0A9E8N8K6_9BACT|nr:SDR family oxidoreductase [Dyadobacter pollutisoli]WAC11920.1 SDR family oxidoreductase [Dyadobacter pollutisoli]